MASKPTDLANDIDPKETQEWREALESVIEFESSDRASFLLKQLINYANRLGIEVPSYLHTPYINTISPDQEAKLSKEECELVEKLTDIHRWNAIAMVMHAGKVDSSLGGHIASYASCSLLFEIGLNYFFHAPQGDHQGDLVFYQGHSSPGIYARAFLEGRLSKEQLKAFRQEYTKKGVASYPHAWLMPEFWQFATVSMGFTALMSIYQAQFLKYLENRGLQKTHHRKVWAFLGDGEMDEPESLGAIRLAGREKLDNLIFVVSCNLQRLDGPVYGNGQIIQELEGMFRGANWHVIKSIWGIGWDSLFAKDQTGILFKRINELVDGEYQNYSAKDGAYLREHFFGKYPELKALVADMSDEQLKQELVDAGHDPQRVYAAYHAAVNHKGSPVVVLVKTVKGYGMGQAGEGMNIAHNAKKMALEYLKEFRDKFQLPLNDEQLEKLEFLKPVDTDPVMKFLKQQRDKLGGPLPQRRHQQEEKLIIPPLEVLKAQLESTGEREISSTMAFVRILATLLKDKNIKERVVPIVADESRTFGMEGLFRQIGIYAPMGQLYEPEDKKQLMYYREDKRGQLFQQGLSEAGSFSCWIAAGISYETNALPMVPFFIYYSMFGFQRFGDLAWAAADMRVRGFLMGGTAGRTTLNGEGLQHEDGHNLLLFSVVPNCRSYDPTFAYELAVIIHHGLKQMYEDRQDVFYYITLMNENYQHPAMPEGVEEGIIKGLYLFQKAQSKKDLHVNLMGSGTIFLEILKAADILKTDYKVDSTVWAAPSFNELRRDLEAVERYNRLNPSKKLKKPYVTECLEKHVGPVIAATDYIKLYADQIRDAVPHQYYVLGTNGFGRSDTRAGLRDFFEVDAKMIVYTALKALADEDKFSQTKLMQAKKKLRINSDRINPVDA